MDSLVTELRWEGSLLRDECEDFCLSDDCDRRDLRLELE